MPAGCKLHCARKPPSPRLETISTEIWNRLHRDWKPSPSRLETISTEIWNHLHRDWKPTSPRFETISTEIRNHLRRDFKASPPRLETISTEIGNRAVSLFLHRFDCALKPPSLRLNTVQFTILHGRNVWNIIIVMNTPRTWYHSLGRWVSKRDDVLCTWGLINTVKNHLSSTHIT